MPFSYDDIASKHYKDEAEKWGDSPCSTMDDEIIRQRETELILKFFEAHVRGDMKVADIGCGNGFSLGVLSRDYPNNEFWGIDTSQALLAIARNRGLVNCQFVEEDVTSLNFADNFFDIVFTQRCLINILSWEKQKRALSEIHRLLKPGGYYLMIECFIDGHKNYNRARVECGLPEIEAAPYNRYIEKEEFLQYIEGKFLVLDYTNFLSSHYFIARVLHPLVTKGEQIKNTEFVQFFSHLPPIGNYSPIQSYVLQGVSQ